MRFKRGAKTMRKMNMGRNFTRQKNIMYAMTKRYAKTYLLGHYKAIPRLGDRDEVQACIRQNTNVKVNISSEKQK